MAVAAGLAPLAVGTETDGSIVSPSHACGIVGIKPTLGLISRSGIVPISAEQDTAGPMTRSVADAAALLGALAGADQADPATAAAAARPADYTQFLDPAALAGARIGIWRDGSAQATAAAAAVLDDVVSLLRAQGAELVDPVTLAGADKIGEHEFVALRHEFKDDLNAYLAALGGEHPGSLAELIEFNIAHADRVLTHFGQEIFEQAEATSRPVGARMADREGAGSDPGPLGPGQRVRRAPARRRAGPDRQSGVAHRSCARRSLQRRDLVAGGRVRVPGDHGPGGRGERAARGDLADRAGLERAAADRPGPFLRAGPRLRYAGRAVSAGGPRRRAAVTLYRAGPTDSTQVER